MRYPFAKHNAHTVAFPYHLHNAVQPIILKLIGTCQDNSVGEFSRLHVRAGMRCLLELLVKLIVQSRMLRKFQKEDTDMLVL